jgi:hypothetical protein
MLRAIASTPVCIMPGENYDMRLPGKGNEIQPFLYFIYSRRALSLPFHSCPVGLFQSLLGVFHIHFIPFLHDISILAGSVSHSFPALFLNPYRVRFHIHFIPSLHNISILAGFLLHSSPALFLNHYWVPCWVQFLFHFILSRPAGPSLSTSPVFHSGCSDIVVPLRSECASDVLFHPHLHGDHMHCRVIKYLPILCYTTVG